MIALAAAIALLFAALTAAISSQWAFGQRRLLLQRSAVYAMIPAVTAVLLLLPLQFDLNFSDGLSIVGLALSVLFGFGARTLERVTSRVRIGIVIPSRVPFHVELRAGFTDAISVLRTDIYDDYLTRNNATENLADFVPSLRRTLAWGPDYLLVCSPSEDLVSSDHVADQLLRFARRGGGVIFIDNPPVGEILEKLRGRQGTVTSDVEQGAIFIAGFLDQVTDPGDDILVLAGPPTSVPAEVRRKTIQQMVKGAQIVVINSGGWTEQLAYTSTDRYLKSHRKPRFVVAGNDVMAFGVIRALRDTSTSGVGVIGYDGIARALYAIADQGNPMIATVRTPPSAYGHEAAAMIIRDVAMMRRKSGLHRSVIAMSPGQLISAQNVEMVLDG